MASRVYRSIKYQIMEKRSLFVILANFSNHYKQHFQTMFTILKTFLKLLGIFKQISNFKI